jgi:formamidopyrimidine-DNA glycosylase
VGTTIVEYANQLYLLDRKILQVGATHLPARDQVYMVIMKLKEHKNLAIRAKVMEYLSRMNKEDFPTSRDEVLETLSNLAYEVFVIDAKRKFIKNKTARRRRQIKDYLLGSKTCIVRAEFRTSSPGSNTTSSGV